MDGWDWVLLAIAAYVAVTSLARLMSRRRETLLAELRWKAEQEQAEVEMASKQTSQNPQRKSA